MSKVILDTDVLIDVLRGREGTRAVVQALVAEAIPCCSVISVAELFAGMRPEEQAATEDLLAGMAIFPITRGIAELAGRFKRRARGHKLELADCLIAATALMEGASLATGNAKDYPMPEITVITVRAR